MATLREIAEQVRAPKPAIEPEILRVSSIEGATPVTLVFATDALALAAALKSPAGGILTKPGLLVGNVAEEREIDTADPRLLPVTDPRYAFALAARFLQRHDDAGDYACGPHPRLPGGGAHYPVRLPGPWRWRPAC